MAGFNKIDLNTDVKAGNQPKNDSLFMTVKKKRSLRFKNKKLVLVAGGIIVFFLLLAAITAVPAFNTYTAGMATYRQAKMIATAMKQQNVTLASEELEKTKQSLQTTRKHFDQMFYLKFVPIVNFYYGDADHALRAGEYGLKSATIVIDSLKPYADVLGLKGQGSFSAGSAEDRIKTAVMTMGRITPKVDEIADSLLLIQKEIDQINPGHYPELLFGKKPKTELTQIRDLTDQSVELVNEARPLIKVLPSLLGESEEKKYLVLFQNDKELRATGGFITAYTIMKIDKGRISIERSDDIYPLDDSIPNKPEAPDPIVNYLPKVPRLNLRDSNLSPDFVTSMKTFKSLYDKAGQGVDVDGIIAIDTHVLVSTIKVLDDQVQAAGMTFTTQVDKRCDCPQVIYELENDISRPVNYVKTDRKYLIRELMNTIMVKALSSSPKAYWGKLFQTMLMLTNQKHILFYLYDKDAQSGIEALEASGKIVDFEGDYLHINDTNFGGQKSNLFTKHTVEVAYDKKNDGKIEKTITINYKNTFPPSNCDLEAGQLCLNAPLRNWLRVYVPKGSKLVSSKGSQVKLQTYDELGKTVFDGFLTVRPLGSAKFTITYTLPFKVDSNSLPILIQKQAGTEGHEYIITANGRPVQKFQLFADKEMEIKL